MNNAATHSSSRGPGFFARLGMAAKLITRGGMAEVVDYFRRAKSGSLSGGPAEPYEQVVAVFRCVQFLAEAVSFMPFCVSTGDDRVIESGPIAELLDRPNPMMSIDEFWQQTVGWMLLSERGCCYWVFTRRIGGRPVELLPVGDAQVRPITANRERGTGPVIAWEYRAAGRRWDEAERLELDEVWQVKVPGFDPDRPWAGTGVLNVIRRAINQVYKSDIANEASLDNGVEPGGVLILDGAPSPDQELSIKDAMDERRGAANRRRHLVLKGNIRWEQIAASFTDMEFEKLKRYSRADVCAGFGLDPSAVGFPPEGGRFEYAEAAESKAWIGRVLPLAKSLASNFDRGVLSHYERDQSMRMGRSLDDARPMRRRALACGVRAANFRGRLYAWFDASVVEAVKELYKSRVETASKMVRDLKATPSEAGELLDLGLADNDAQKIVWQSTTEMPFDPIQPGADDPSGTPGSPGTPAPESTTDDDAGDDAATEGGEEETVEQAAPQQREVSDAQLAKIHQAWRASWAPLEKAMAGRVGRHFNALRRETLARLDQQRAAHTPGDASASIYKWTDFDDDGRPVERSASYTLDAVQRDLIGEVLFDLVTANRQLVASVRPLVRTATTLGGEQSMREHADATDQDEPDVFNIQEPEVARTIQRREIKITGVNRTVRRRLAAQLAEGLEAGETTQELAARVKREFNFASARSKTIARTEVGGAVEEGRQLGRSQAGVPLKSWLWSRKETGRPWHSATEQATLAEPVANDELFTIAQTGNTCMHPRGTGDATDDINCGCTTIARYPGDSIKSVADRYLRRMFLTTEQLAARTTKEQAA